MASTAGASAVAGTAAAAADDMPGRAASAMFVVHHAFKGTSEAELTLHPGELVRVLEQEKDGWWYGVKVKNKGVRRHAGRQGNSKDDEEEQGWFSPFYGELIERVDPTTAASSLVGDAAGAGGHKHVRTISRTRTRSEVMRGDQKEMADERARMVRALLEAEASYLQVVSELVPIVSAMEGSEAPLVRAAMRSAAVSAALRLYCEVVAASAALVGALAQAQTQTQQQMQPPVANPQGQRAGTGNDQAVAIKVLGAFEAFATAYHAYPEFASYSSDALHAMRKFSAAIMPLVVEMDNSIDSPASVEKHLLYPVQRYPEYLPWFEQYLGLIAADVSLDRELVTQAQRVYARLLKFTEQMDNVMVQEQEKLQVLALDSQFAGVQVYGPQRRLIHTGMITVVNAGGKSARSVLHLFNDLLIVSVQRGQRLYVKRVDSLFEGVVRNHERDEGTLELRWDVGATARGANNTDGGNSNSTDSADLRRVVAAIRSGGGANRPAPNRPGGARATTTEGSASLTRGGRVRRASEIAASSPVSEKTPLVLVCSGRGERDEWAEKIRSQIQECTNKAIAQAARSRTSTRGSLTERARLRSQSLSHRIVNSRVSMGMVSRMSEVVQITDIEKDQLSARGKAIHEFVESYSLFSVSMTEFVESLVKPVAQMMDVNPILRDESVITAMEEQLDFGGQADSTGTSRRQHAFNAARQEIMRTLSPDQIRLANTANESNAGRQSDANQEAQEKQHQMQQQSKTASGAKQHGRARSPRRNGPGAGAGASAGAKAGGRRSPLKTNTGAARTQHQQGAGDADAKDAVMVMNPALATLQKSKSSAPMGGTAPTEAALAAAAAMAASGSALSNGSTTRHPAAAAGCNKTAARAGEPRDSSMSTSTNSSNASGGGDGQQRGLFGKVMHGLRRNKNSEDADRTSGSGGSALPSAGGGAGDASGVTGGSSRHKLTNKLQSSANSLANMMLRNGDEDAAAPAAGSGAAGAEVGRDRALSDETRSPRTPTFGLRTTQLDPNFETKCLPLIMASPIAVEALGGPNSVQARTAAQLRALNFAEVRFCIEALLVIEHELRLLLRHLDVVAVRDGWNDMQISSCLFAHEPLFASLRDYGMQFHAALQRVEASAFAGMLDDCLPMLDPVTIEDQLHEPLNVLETMSESLQQVADTTDKGRPDKENLTAMYQQLEVLVTELSARLAKARDLEELRRVKRCIVVQKRLWGDPWLEDLVQEGRRLICEGDMNKVCRRGVRPYRAWLFNDLLMYGTQILPNMYAHHRSIPLSSAKAYRPLPTSDGRPGMVVESPAKTMTFLLDTVAERDDWLRVTNEAMEAARNNLRDRAIRVAMGASHVGMAAPLGNEQNSASSVKLSQLNKDGGVTRPGARRISDDADVRSAPGGQAAGAADRSGGGVDIDSDDSDATVGREMNEPEAVANHEQAVAAPTAADLDKTPDQNADTARKTPGTTTASSAAGSATTEATSTTDEQENAAQAVLRQTAVLSPGATVDRKSVRMRMRSRHLSLAAVAERAEDGNSKAAGDADMGDLGSPGSGGSGFSAGSPSAYRPGRPSRRPKHRRKVKASTVSRVQSGSLSSISSPDSQPTTRKRRHSSGSGAAKPRAAPLAPAPTRAPPEVAIAELPGFGAAAAAVAISAAEAEVDEERTRTDRVVRFSNKAPTSSSGGERSSLSTADRRRLSAAYRMQSEDLMRDDNQDLRETRHIQDGRRGPATSDDEADDGADGGQKTDRAAKGTSGRQGAEAEAGEDEEGSSESSEYSEYTDEEDEGRQSMHYGLIGGVALGLPAPRARRSSVGSGRSMRSGTSRWSEASDIASPLPVDGAAQTRASELPDSESNSFNYDEFSDAEEFDVDGDGNIVYYDDVSPR